MQAVVMVERVTLPREPQPQVDRQQPSLRLKMMLEKPELIGLMALMHEGVMEARVKMVLIVVRGVMPIIPQQQQRMEHLMHELLDQQ
jgi:hypothetical protein